MAVMVLNNEDNQDVVWGLKDLKQRQLLRREELRDKVRKKKAKYLLTRYGITILIIIVALIILSPFISKFSTFTNEYLTSDVMKKLNFYFNGKFKIISPEIETKDDLKSNTLYKVIDQNGIIFNIYSTNTFIVTDYNQYLYKKYLLEYLKINDIPNIKYEDGETEKNGGMYFTFKYGVEINSYKDIDRVFNDSIKGLMEYMEKCSKKDFDFQAIDFITYIYINGLEEELYYYEYNFNNMEYLSNKVKVDYINYLVQNKLIDNTVSQEDYKSFYRPMDMKLIINNADTHVKLRFDYGDMNYYIELYNVKEFLKYFDSYVFDVAGYLSKFTYKGNEYYLDSDLRKNLKGNKYSVAWSISTICDFFGAEVEYDYDDKIINIIIPDR